MGAFDKPLFKQVQQFGDKRWIQTPDSPNDGDTLIYDLATDTWISSAPADTSVFIEKPAGAVLGDTLRYNGSTWVAADADTTGLSLFSAYNHTTQSITTDTDITYDTHITIDSNVYTHTTSAASVTVLSTGTYFVEAETTINATGGCGTTQATAWVSKNGTEVVGTRTYATLKATNDYGTLRVARALNLTANDVVKFIVSFTSLGVAFSTVADTTRFSLTTEVVTAADIPSGTAGTPMGLLLALTYAA